MMVEIAEAITVNLHEKQFQFLSADARFRGFVGGRGAGKSFVGAYDLLKRAKPNRKYGVLSPTLRLLKRSAWPELLGQAQKFGLYRDQNKADFTMTLNNGAYIMGFSADNSDKQTRGPNLSGLWIDEAQGVDRDVFYTASAMLREAGELGWLTATFTPAGRSHWTYDKLFKGDENYCCVQASTRDNVFLPDGFYEELLAQYGGDTLRAKQELEGQFVDLEGAEFDSRWFHDGIWVDRSDLPISWVWRTSALDPSMGRQSKLGDYQAFINLMGCPDGKLYVDADLVRVPVTKLAERVVDVQQQFNPNVFGIETNQFQELIAHEVLRESRDRQTPVYIQEIDNRINKVVRIRRLAYHLSQDMFRFVRSPGCELLVEQLRDFPEGDHDDGPDALEMAHRVARQMVGDSEV